MTLAARFGDRDFLGPGQILRGQAVGIGQHFLGCPRCHDMAAMDTRARAHIHQIIRRANGVFVMFHDDHRIAQIPQPPQRIQKAIIVALMQTDGGFVQDIQNARQARPDLRGQTNALAFPTAQCAGIPAERQIVQADIVQESQSLINLF